MADDVFETAFTEDSFIFCDALKVTPVLESFNGPEGGTWTSFLPNDHNGTWVSMQDFTQMNDIYEHMQGENITYFATDKINV
jgi:hypothetical protein